MLYPSFELNKLIEIKFIKVHGGLKIVTSSFKEIILFRVGIIFSCLKYAFGFYNLSTKYGYEKNMTFTYIRYPQV